MTRKGLLMQQGWVATFAVELMVMTFALFSLMFSAVLSASAQEIVWKQTNGPHGGDIRALLATPDGTLYAGTSGSGVFHSEDGGNTWTGGLLIQKA